MSFSQEVKDELSRQFSTARHCRLAELAAMLSYGGQIKRTGSHNYLRFQTESIAVARKYFTLIKKTFNINMDLSIRATSHAGGNHIYTLMIRDTESIKRVLQAAKLSVCKPEDKKSNKLMELVKPDQLVVQNACCKRAFIRGAFLVSGSMSNPKKAYHLEIVIPDQSKAEQLQKIIQTFSIDAKIVTRKKSFVVYIKEGSQIVDLLNVMEAHVALMDLENVRILKEVRNQVNRQVNCEAANISKTVAASAKQIEDIVYIRDTIGFSELAEGLEEIARLRIQHPEASLKELGTMLTPSIGKSGVNHRLRKLSMIADHIREHKEENSHDNKTNSN
ncbi:MAG: DNA-binding protein WhiA [Lachnospiraceae bacterium]|jgi:DNA-binding protein WhiA|nr:DNA-binding protein WhiA [Lachnospiraceae bacterium]